MHDRRKAQSLEWSAGRYGGPVGEDYDDAKVEYAAASVLNRACPTLTFRGDKIVRGVPVAPERVDGKDGSRREYWALLDGGNYVSTREAGRLIGRKSDAIGNLWCTHQLVVRTIGDCSVVCCRSLARYMLALHNDKNNPYTLDRDPRRMAFVVKHGGKNAQGIAKGGRTA